MKVKIKNFQSIKEAELEIEGFTAIVGRSNIGKSAVVRAIEGAFTNKEGDHFVRDGASHTEVNIECPEIVLNWKKGSGKNDYIIDGETLENVGRGAPEHIGEAGFREIEANRSKINVQIASQFSPIFLLDPSKTSGAVAAEIISDIGRLSEVQTALRSCEKDRRDFENTVRVREKDLDTTREKIQEYDELDDDMRQVEEIKDQYADIGFIQTEIKTFSDLQEERSNVIATIETYDGLEEIEIPSEDFDSDLENLRNLNTLSGLYQEQTQIIESYEGLEDIEIPDPDFDSEFKQLQVFITFSGHVKKARNDVEIWEGLEDIEIPDLKDVEPSLEELETLSDMEAQFDSLSDSIPFLTEEIDRLDQEIEEAKEEVHEILHEAGECPMCGTEVE